MDKALNDFTGIIRRAVDDYNMIEEGDKIAVGVSGGKDSMLLLLALNHLKKYYPKQFELEAITIELGFEGMDFDPVAKMCEDLGICYTRVKTDIKEVVFDIRKEENPCSLCAKMRRGALNDAIKQRGINKLALGHHFDDAVETFYINLFYAGSLSCFQPVTYLDRTDITQIRPLLYCGEGQIRNVAARENLPVVRNTCPADGATKRQEVKELIADLSKKYPKLKDYTFGAMQRLPLPEWGVVDKE